MRGYDRFEELLILRASAGLTRAESVELDAMVRAHPDWDTDQFDLAAAAIQLALVETEEMPGRVRQQLQSFGSAI